MFGAPLDEARYDAVLDQCALKRDLELFEAGDMTEVGEKGVTLRYNLIYLDLRLRPSCSIYDVLVEDKRRGLHSLEPCILKPR